MYSWKVCLVIENTCESQKIFFSLHYYLSFYFSMNCLELSCAYPHGKCVWRNRLSSNYEELILEQRLNS